MKITQSTIKEKKKIGDGLKFRRLKELFNNKDQFPDIKSKLSRERQDGDVGTAKISDRLLDLER
jgi:hypothetical protein